MKKAVILTAIISILIFTVKASPVYAVVDSGYGATAADMLGTANSTEKNSSSDSNASVIKIDGDFDDWDDMPYSYEYNWNNPYKYIRWNPETNRNESVEIRDENGKPYNTVIRHKMSLYRDGKYVYLHIIMAENYYTSLNGNDYQFYCDGQMAAFQITAKGGKTISERSFGEGIHKVEIRHRNSGISWQIAKGSEAVLKRKAGGVNDELELKIPFSEMHRQNQNIDTDNIRVIEFFTPNLMYRRITCAGTGTAPFVGAAICAALAVFGYFIYKKRKC